MLVYYFSINKLDFYCKYWQTFQSSYWVVMEKACVSEDTFIVIPHQSVEVMFRFKYIFHLKASTFLCPSKAKEKTLIVKRRQNDTSYFSSLERMQWHLSWVGRGRGWKNWMSLTPTHFHSLASEFTTRTMGGSEERLHASRAIKNAAV